MNPDTPATPSANPTPDPATTPVEPTPTAEPEPTPEPAAAAPEPTPEPVAAPVPEPVAEPAPAPEPLPTPTPEPAVAPIEPVAAAPAATPAVAPAAPAPAGVPAPKKKHTLRNVLLIIAGIFVLLLVIGGVTAYLATQKSVTDANGFVNAIVKKDYTTAYGYFSEGLKKNQSADDFQTAVSGAPFDSSCKLKITDRKAASSTSDGTVYTLGGDIACGSTNYPITMQFITEGGADKLNAYTISPAK